MDRDRGDRDRDRGRPLKKPRTSTSSVSSESRHRDRDVKPEEKTVVVVTGQSEDKPVVLNKKDLYEKVCNYEYEEAKAMDAVKARETYSKVVAQLEENVREIFTLRQNGELDAEKKMELKLEALNYLTSLKTINRLLKYKLKNVKDEQYAKRLFVDTEHLKLQNLLYEATNLQNQVAAVQEYKSQDEKIELIPVEKFYEEAPERVTRPEVTKNDPHLLRIARLEYEYIQREKLTEQIASLEKEKEVIGKTIEQKQAKLDSIRPLLKNVQESTVPVEDFLGLEITSRRQILEIARYLPSPLFVLFVQSEAYQEHGADGKKYFSVKIEGDIDAAKEWQAEENEAEVEEDSDSERNDEQETEVSEKRTLRKRTSIGSSLDSRQRAFQRHPLWIQWIVKTRAGESVMIHFHYLTKLKIVTITSLVRRDSTEGTKSTSFSDTSDTILTELYPDDCGTTSPNPSNLFLFHKLGISSISSYLKDTGKPYKWAQKICGIEFPEQANACQDDGKPKMEVSCRNIEGIIKQIRRRLTNQSKLWTQLKALEAKNICIPPAAKELLPQKNSASLISWETITFETFCSFKFSEPLVRRNVASVKDMFFKAILQRGTAKMIALAVVKMDFPATSSVFCVQLDVEGKRRNTATDAAIREAELNVNVNAPEEFKDWPEHLISIQLHRLMTCCDIILESDGLLGESEGPSQFSREKLMLKATSGRNLRRPFQFVNQGGGYFTQRY